ncbi:MAG: class I SAM-dependent methyltransferase [Notoacmeibacter sp.]|nr:class I SAM-dependent methyltransferase [Notoacmeibacter sp.]MCC0033410.1 class I SAM-dependent methyltransferase [Brucellaceae bacterium]
MTALKRKLIARIAAAGPMSVAEYFAACLLDPADGYYTTREPFGREGDFITAPEISQMFGELLAVWAFRNWDAMGRPAPFVFAEIGPGRGTLMADMARTLARIEGGAFLAAAKVFMIEASPRLANVQREHLAGSPVNPDWISGIDALPALPLILIGNELFDAIPIRQFVHTGSQWRERMVTVAPDGDTLAFAIGAPTLDDTGPHGAGAPAAEGAIREVSPARAALMEMIAATIAASGGAGLFIDYGFGTPGLGDTLQAVKDHAFDPVLEHPGEADLTSHVDFAALDAVARAGGLMSRFTTQGAFLLGLGLLERAGALGAGKDAATQEAIRSQAERLAGAGGMGELFKVLALGPEQTLWTP